MNILIVREICKTIMFIVIWAMPFALAYNFGNTYYLFFFIVSFLVSVGVFSHYEDLANNERKGETNE